MSAISFKAVALAVVAMMGLDILSGIALSTILAGPEFDREMTDEQARAAFAALVLTRPFLIGSAVLGTLTTVIGGYLAARLAGTLPYMNAFAFGVVGIVLGAVMSKGLPLWYNVLGFTIVLPAALLGGHIAKRQAIAQIKR